MPDPSHEAPIIEVKNLVKEYRLGALEGIRTLGRRLLGKPVPPRQRFRALDDVSMSIRRGEVVGIIGHNGAGKSTLLKLLCQITKPTSGKIKVNGRIAPLIEVGAGLVGEMTGRENIYLNATILGLTRPEIDAKIDEIIEFSELGQFIDTPIKRYSSGMQVRLGYAIATAIDSEILIVDEVLAVGDLQFQRKSIERMQRLIHESNRTVLIVGHNVRQLERVCTRVIMLDHGKVVADGMPGPVVGEFYEKVQNKELAKSRSAQPHAAWVIESSGIIDVTSVTIETDTRTEAGYSVEFGSALTVRIVIESQREIPRLDMGLAVLTLDYLPVAISELTSAPSVGPFTLSEGHNEFVCTLTDLPLMPGVYCFRLGVKDNWGQLIWGANNICPFEVRARPDDNRARYSDFAFVQIKSRWQQMLNLSDPYTKSVNSGC
ncbi:MAG: polysaccharide ABC transporter ATP-binding protein [Pseudomonadota bacterium]